MRVAHARCTAHDAVRAPHARARFAHICTHARTHRVVPRLCLVRVFVIRWIGRFARTRARARAPSGGGSWLVLVRCCHAFLHTLLPTTFPYNYIIMVLVCFGFLVLVGRSSLFCIVCFSASTVFGLHALWDTFLLGKTDNFLVLIILPTIYIPLPFSFNHPLLLYYLPPLPACHAFLRFS